MTDVTVGPVVWGPIVAAICELAKRLGLESKWVPLLNAFLSILGIGLLTLVTQKPDTLNVVVMLLQMLIAFLAAAGVYTTVKYAAQQVKQVRSE